MSSSLSPCHPATSPNLWRTGSPVQTESKSKYGNGPVALRLIRASSHGCRGTSTAEGRELGLKTALLLVLTQQPSSHHSVRHES